jgi:hypothetical protein
VLKSGTALAALGAVGSLSGCFGLFGNDDGSVIDQNSRARQIPSASGALLSVDFEAVRNDDGLVAGADAVLERRHERDESMPRSVAAALDALDERYMLDPRKMHRTTAFVGEEIYTVFGNEPAETPFWGVLGETDWESDRMVRSFREVSRTETTERTYSGVSLYDNGREVVAPLGDGRVVLGSDAAVRATIDIDQGEGSGVGGQLRRAFDGTNGEYARFGSALDMRALGERLFGSQVADALPLASIQWIGTAAFRDGSQRGLRIRSKLGSATDAEQLATTAESFVALARGQGISGALAPYERLIQDIEATSNGKRMTAAYRASPAEFNEQAGNAIADLLVRLTSPT